MFNFSYQIQNANFSSTIEQNWATKHASGIIIYSPVKHKYNSYDRR